MGQLIIRNVEYSGIIDWADIQNKPETFPADPVDWSNLQNKPTTFTPSTTQGSFTPLLRNKTTQVEPSYSSRSGSYIRIGNLVNFLIDIAVSSTISSVGNAVEIFGLPVAPTSTTPVNIDWRNLVSQTSGAFVAAEIVANGAIDLFLRSNTGRGTFTTAMIASNTIFRVTGSFICS